MLVEHGRQQRAGSTQGRRPGVYDLHAPPPGSKNGARIQGLPRNLGDLLVSSESWNLEAEREAEQPGGAQKSEGVKRISV